MNLFTDEVATLATFRLLVGSSHLLWLQKFCHTKEPVIVHKQQRKVDLFAVEMATLATFRSRSLLVGSKHFLWLKTFCRHT